MELLQELCECTGIPGREERLREIARRELAPLADELQASSEVRLACDANVARVGVSSVWVYACTSAGVGARKCVDDRAVFTTVRRSS